MRLCLVGISGSIPWPMQISRAAVEPQANAAITRDHSGGEPGLLARCQFIMKRAVSSACVYLIPRSPPAR